MSLLALNQSHTILSSQQSDNDSLAARLSCRDGSYTSPTCNLAQSHIQTNLLVLPSRYASDFRLLCQRNPVPCPLIAESKSVGSFNLLKSCLPGIDDCKMAKKVDLRTDITKYMVYKDGKLTKFECSDILQEWTEDHIAFLIGCSFSFESSLLAAGLPPRQSVLQRNVPMYRTNIPLCPAGVFTGGTYIVSMRSYKKSEISKARDVTRPFTATHGEPIAWGWNAVKALGIADINQPDWGDSPLTLDERPLSEMEGNDDDVPVFWACGVTPQNAVMAANLEGIIMAHAPGYMLVMDLKDSDIINQVHAC